MSDHHGILTFFLGPEVIFISQTVIINASRKEFTLENNVIPNYYIAFVDLLYYDMVANVY